MSQWSDLCWEQPTHFDWVLCTVDMWPILCSAALFGASAVSNSLYLWILWAATLIDYGINLGLRYAIKQASPNGALAHHAWEMPSAGSSALLCIGVMMILFILLYNVQSYTLYAVCLYATGMVAMYARLHQGINTPQQTVVGALTGTLLGVILTALWHLLGYPYVPYILSWAPMRWWGITDYFMRGRMMAHIRDADLVVEVVRQHAGLQDTRQAEMLILWAADRIKSRRFYADLYNNNNNNGQVMPPPLIEVA